MTPGETAEVIEIFFTNHSAAGLVLPSGWFGRPYDNLHQLTECRVAGDIVRVELDGQLGLSFEGAAMVAVLDSTGLVIRGFTKLHWDRRSFGSAEEHHQVFSDGEVTFVPPLG